MSNFNNGIISIGQGGTAATTAQNALNNLKGKAEWYAAVNGVKANGRAASDGAITSGTATFTSATVTFTAADIGKYITILGAGAAGVSLNTTIIGVSAGAATLNVNASTTVSGANFVFGSDDAPALNALTTTVNAAGGGIIVLPRGIIVTASSINIASLVSYVGQGIGVTIFKYISPTSMLSAVFSGLSGSAANPYTDNYFANFEVDLGGATQATYNVAGKGFYVQYMRRPRFINIYVHDSPASGFGVDFLQGGLFVGCIATNCGRLNDGTQAGGSGIGIGTANNATLIEDTLVTGCRLFGNKRYGVFFETQVGSVSTKAYNRVIGNHFQLNAASNVGVGDSGSANMIIGENTFYSDNGTGTGIKVDNGTLAVPGGAYGLISNNSMYNMPLGVVLDATGNATSIANYTISNNVIRGTGDAAIKAISHASSTFPTLRIHNNFLANNGGTDGAIYISGTAAYTDLEIKGNTVFGAVNGVKIEAPVTRMVVQGNSFRNNTTYGLVIKTAAVSGGTIRENYFNSNTTAAYGTVTGGTYGGSFINNVGYNPYSLILGTQFDKTNTTLSNAMVTPINVTAGATYKFIAKLFYNADVTGGHKYAIAGTATATSIIYQINSIANATNLYVINSTQTALAGSAGQAGSTAGYTEINGTITVNAAGTLSLQFAQNAANGTSSLLVGSSFELIQAI